MSITSEIRLRVRKEGDVVLNQLSAKLNDVAKRSTLTSAKFKDLSSTLKQTDNQIRTKSINGLNDYARAWRELANSVDITSREFKEATREAQRFEQAAAKAQGRRGGGRLAGLAKGAGAVAASGIFGGAEGFLGAGIGLAFGGPMGAAVGGAIGAQVGQARQQLGATATYAAELQKQRIALAGLTSDYAQYQKALERVERLSQQFQIPQEIITRQFTKLAASVIGAGGSLDDTEKAFKGVAAGIRGTGGDLQDLSSALTATAQVFSKGKVSAEELRQQIGERLPGAFTLFAQSLGMTPAELDKALEDGKVSLQDFQKFSELLFEKFGKSAEAIVNGPAAAGERLQVQLSKLSENVGKLLAPIGAAFQNVFTEIIRLINGAAVALNKLFKIDLSGEVESITAQISQLEQAPGKETARQRRARLKTLNDLRRDLKQATQQRALLSIGAGGGKPPTGLPGAPDAAGAAKAKGSQDFSVQFADALISAQNELNPIKKIQLEYDAEILKINESNLEPQKKRVALNAAANKLNEQAVKLGNQMASGVAALFIKDGERNEQIKQTIQNLEIEAGIIDKKQAKQIEKDRLIQELQKDGATLTEEQLKRIDEAYARINEKTSESMQLFRQIGQNVVSALSDAFTSLFDQAKSLRDVLTDLLRSTARLFVEFGIRAGMKSLFPSLFANGGVMTGKGPMPLKRYASGGVANSPQLAMFGEGSTPEAYVPLPDGRSIPVTMRNGGGDTNIVVNVEAGGTTTRGGDASGSSRALGSAIAAAVQAELIKQQRPGGLLA